MSGDLISRQDAIAKFKKTCTYESIDKNGIKRGEIHFAMTYEKIIKIIESLPSAEPERKWIPVTEKLPEDKEMVLITNKKGHVRCGQYQGIFDDKNYRWWWIHNTLEEVLAWMPLPEPYRGE